MQATKARPFDRLGPASDPIDFPGPQVLRGRRGNVVCHNAVTRKDEVVENVLFQDFSHGEGGQYAYFKLPYKEPIQTIMGHVEICRVLERVPPAVDDDDSSSENAGGEYEIDEEIHFEWTDRRVAVKVNYVERMENLRDRHAENPLQEIAAMQLLGENPVHVLGALEVLFDGQNLNVVMRFCDNGDLFQLLQDNQNRRVDAAPDTPGLTESACRYWFRQVIEGIQFLHSRGICHRDLSPENIMIDRKEGLIIDMGMSLRVPYIDPDNPDARTDISNAQDDSTRCLFRPQGPCGKLPYMSPEIYANNRPFDGAGADVWTAGTILFCMITGNRSYQRPHMTDPQFYWMSQGLRQLLSDWHVSLSDEGIELLSGMLTVDQSLRLTLGEVAAHPWFDHPDEEPMEHEQ